MRVAVHWCMVGHLAVGFTALGQPAPKAPPDRLSELQQAASQALETKRYREAEQALSTLLDEPGGETAETYHNLGIVYGLLGEHDRAVTNLRLAAERREDAGSRMLLGANLLALGKVEDAISEFEKAVRLDPARDDARLQLAGAFESSGNVSKMVEQLRGLRRMRPEEPDYAYRLGKAYTLLGAWSIQRLYDLDSDSVRAHQALGENYLAQGKLKLAERSLSLAVARGPETPGLHWSLAQVYLRLGDTQKALRALERELEIIPGNLMALNLKKRLGGEARQPGR